MTVGRFFLEYNVPGRIEPFKKLLKAEGVPHLEGSYPYKYPVKEMLRMREVVMSRVKRVRYSK